MINEQEIRSAIKEMFLSGSYDNGTSKMFRGRHGDMLEHMRTVYPSLPRDSKTSELCYLFYYGLNGPRLCRCGKPLAFLGFNRGYRDYCSSRCRFEDKEALENAKKVRSATTLKKYGVENVFLLKEIQDRARRTRSEKYGDEHYSNHEKARRTCLARYGSEFPGGSPIIKERILKTVRERFGVDHTFSSKEVMEKAKSTCLARYGVEYAAQNPEIYAKTRKTNAERYGCECVLENAEIKSKAEESMLNRYGVRSFSQSREYHLGKRHKFFSRIDPDVSFNSTWEVQVYDYCLRRGVVPTISPCSIPYYIDGVEHRYIPDFLINGHLVEVKGGQFVDGDSWTLPYRKPEWTDETFDENNRRYMAKGICAKEHGVVVIGDDEIDDLDASLGPLLDGSKGQGAPKPSFCTYGFDIDSVVGICLKSEFPGTAKWERGCPIWLCNVKGKKSPRAAWAAEPLLRRAVANMFSTVSRAKLDGESERFVIEHESALKTASEGDASHLARLVLRRFSHARIAPKVTALPKSLFLNIVDESGIDLSAGVYCPMAGFGGIIEGAKSWLVSHGVDPSGRIYAADINPALCSYYGWTQKDVLSDTVETDKVVVACPPFSDLEQWPGTPAEMYRTFEEWARLLKEHIKAPRYILIGPVDSSRLVDGRPAMYARRVQAMYYPEHSFPS